MADYILHPEVRRFLKSLTPELKMRSSEQLILLKTFGRQLSPPDSKKVSPELFELRIVGAIQIRLMYGFVGDNIALVVSGFVKKSQKIPPRELKLAHKRLRE